MKLKEANMSGPFKAEIAIVAADPPKIAEAAVKTP